MSDLGFEVLVAALADELHEDMQSAAAGHCLRIDDVDAAMTTHLADQLAERLPAVAVHVLRASPVGERDVAPERAIEIRNRKAAACLLLIPAGEGAAASSLDNSFERRPVLKVFEAVDVELRSRLAGTPVAEPVERLRRFRIGQAESWAEFLAYICAEPTLACLGRNLWRVGLVPDLGDDPGGRIERNRLAVRAISRPARPTSSLDERFTAGGLSEGAWRAALRAYCQAAQLANPRHWGKGIVDHHPELSFHTWQIAEAVADDLESLEVDPFVSPDGVLAKNGLKLGSDGELLLVVPEGSTASLKVTWKTLPAKVKAVDRWSLEVLPPDDLREAESEPLVSLTVKGDKRSCTLKVAADEDSLVNGSRFVVALVALGEHGERINLLDGTEAVADSQEFQVACGDEPVARTRRTAAVSLPEAAVRAALDGMDDLTEDLVSWDKAGQVFGLRLGNRRAIQIRVCDPIVSLQRRITSNPADPNHFTCSGAYGTPLESDRIASRSVSLPNAVKKARSDLLRALHACAPRDTAESASWDDGLRALSRTYLSAYRRALDSADAEVARELLLLDALSLSVRRSNQVIHGVVLLPLHPLRLAWICEHDETLRGWAAQLTEVSPRSARTSQVDAALIARVVPANFPFSVMDVEGRLAIYAEELTHGAGLFLVPDGGDSEAVAEALCSVLQLPRAGSTLHASSAMVAERMRAYDVSHEPSEALRILSVHPGAGQLLAGAIERSMQPTAAGEDVVEVDDDPHRLDVVCYTDSAAYSRPVPALLDVQRDLRTREFSRRGSHLFPPLSVTVRGVDRLLEDPDTAHLAIVQDVGQSTTGFGSATERAPSFRDLLVPIVTRSFDDAGDLVWESVPVTGGRPGRGELELASAHRAHQRAVGRVLDGDNDAVPTVRVVLDGDRLAQIKSAHARADWVIGVDRFVGVDLYEGRHSGDTESYVLDYAPDFVEGIGDRLTVTTGNRAEVERLLEGAMTELGLHDVQHSVGSVLSTLSVVSGRLALRLLGDTSRAREAVSLAAVITHLRDSGELDGQIVVPVDAHHEIFGSAAREEDDGTRRCDLLLVRVTQRSFKIECVEVKSRQEAKLPQALADLIVDQVTDTKRLLESRFFASDPPRIDGELQRARLVSLLHYYADRSANHGLIADDRIDEVHRYIDRIEDSGETAEISMRGYVISLAGDEGFKKKYGDVPLTVLTATDLGRLGFTTRVVPEPVQAALPVEELADPVEGNAQVKERGKVASLDPSPKVDSAPSGDGTLEPPEVEILDPAAAPVRSTGREQAAGPAQPDAGASGAAASSEQPSHSEPAKNRAAGEPESVTVALGETQTGSAVAWRLSTQGSPHGFIIGIPGQGKSVTTRRIIREFAEQGLPSLVFDFHGDMAANPPHGATVLDAALGLPFSPFDADVAAGRPINTTAWQIAEIIGFVAKLGRIQQNHVYKALVNAYGEHGWVGTTPGTGVPSLHEFAASVEAVEHGSQGKNARERLSPFTDFGLFQEEAVGGFAIRQAGGGLVVDLSKLGLEEVQAFGAAFLLRRIYREMFTWGQDKRLRLAVVLDEAHRMAKDPTLPLLMKEGRKFGVSVVVASQSSEDFHDDVLRNVGAKIVFRTNYPASKKVAGFLRGRGGTDISQEIEKLGVGVAYVSTPDDAQARKVYMTE